MKQKIIQLLSLPVTAYLSSGLSCLLLLLSSAVLLFMELTRTRITVAFLLIVFTLVLGWIGWVAYVLNSRRAIRTIHNRLILLERTANRTAENLKKQLSLGEKQHLNEYRKQSYNLLVSLQELRLAALQEKEK